MNGISKSEKHQLRQSLVGASETKENASRFRPGAPVLSMMNYLRQVEEWARLFPPASRAPAQGTHWKL
jgi:hypothetical protein